MHHVTFECYIPARRQWQTFERVFAHVLYDRADSTMLILTTGTFSEFYSVVRDVRIEPFIDMRSLSPGWSFEANR